ncbi:hypothetical protein CWI37_1154p0010 [Hamiltosporidium tvaerminnensis]|uniref:Uncharacterized protein n=1 Tax=Hamiltosporidium tvaerminnensis TaxID=1176355 RepID=A0A4Q9KYB3_9MICR|nr:hypothetical protein CWI37_1154p0010 [Hamiltosporidium tvaerminnensis]
MMCDVKILCDNLGDEKSASLCVFERCEEHYQPKPPKRDEERAKWCYTIEKLKIYTKKVGNKENGMLKFGVNGLFKEKFRHFIKSHLNSSKINEEAIHIKNFDERL